jgi:peptidoglycan/xylan/chitin deacetylase (PgdA/CDA1 family)
VPELGKGNRTSPLLVICYHAISPTWKAELSVTPGAFERQISALVKDGWSPTTFTEAIRGPRSTKTMVITFDDAFGSVKTYAEPVLSRLGAPATVFAPTDYISRGAPLAWAGLDHWAEGPDAAELSPMSWDQLSELAAIGWEIGSHTRTHPKLSTLSDSALTDELRRSRLECAERIGRSVTSVAYPYGDVDDGVVEHARAAGHDAAAALSWPSGPPDPHRYPRVGIYNRDSMPRFRAKIRLWSHSAHIARLLDRRH